MCVELLGVVGHVLFIPHACHLENGIQELLLSVFAHEPHSALPDLFVTLVLLLLLLLPLRLDCLALLNDFLEDLLIAL